MFPRKFSGSFELVVVSKTRFFNHFAGVAITPNQEGTMGMTDEVLSTVGAQDVNTCWCQVSDKDDVEFYGEKLSWT